MIDRCNEVKDLKEALKMVATNCNYKSGKWIAMVAWNVADKFWQKLVQFFLAGNFSEDDVTHMIVKGRQSGADNPNNIMGFVVTDRAAIMVCTSNWTNGERTEDVGRKLKCLDGQVRWKYKANVSALLQSDENNKNYKFPHIYYSLP